MTTPHPVYELLPGDVITLGEGATIGIVVDVTPAPDGWILRAVYVTGVVSDSYWTDDTVFLTVPPPCPNT
jgi:hypothetical protein